jgi:hypothetical protein
MDVQVANSQLALGAFLMFRHGGGENDALPNYVHFYVQFIATSRTLTS